MNKLLKSGSALLLSLALASAATTAIAAEDKDAKKGEFFGAKNTEYPDWFKESFLDFPEDVAEANAAGKRLMLFFFQDGCPYCYAMVERNLAQKDIRAKVQKNLDVIALNMWGDRDVVHTDGKSFIEKTYAEHLKVQFTPTLLFLDEQGKVILRLNGYRSPARFSHDVDYVIKKQEKVSSYRDYIKAHYKGEKSSKKMHVEDFYSKPPYNLAARKGKGKPVAIFFEQKDCPNCDTLHRKVLPDKLTREIIGRFHVIQLDMWSKTAVTDFDGKSTTARQLAKDLDVKFAPSIVLFDDQGKEVIRSEAFFKVFHTQGIFAYVEEKAYRKQPSFQRYLTERADHFREQGKNVDIWNYAGEKSDK